MIGEFELVERYMKPLQAASGVVLGLDTGIGDDGAVLSVPPDQQLVVALDCIVEGVHFPVGTDPEAVGYRALAVNLSDLAAMGADPAWFQLGLMLPDGDEARVAGLTRGLARLVAEFHIPLIGGDTTRGSFSLTVQIAGRVPKGSALLRGGAKPGDQVYVSGVPGEAAGGCQTLSRPDVRATDAVARLQQRFLYPKPRIELGKRLRGIASACIDVSDGLGGDAAKMAEASHCGLLLELDRIPQSRDLVEVFGPERAVQLMLDGGDDYELCFAAPAAAESAVLAAAQAAACPISRIGVLRAAPGAWLLQSGQERSLQLKGFDHFSNA